MRPTKFRNKPTELNGRTYASKAEAARAAELSQLLKMGAILYWMPQPAIELAGIRYKPDFMVGGADGEIWFEDVKGAETQRFRDIRKLWVSSGPPCRLRVLKRAGARWTIAELTGGGNA